MAPERTVLSCLVNRSRSCPDDTGSTCPAPGVEQLAGVGGEENRHNLAVQILDVSGEGSVRAPESDRPVEAAGGQELPIGAPGNGMDGLRVPLEGPQALALGHRPDPRRLVVRRSGQPAGVGSEGNTANAVRVSLEDALALPGGHVPDPRRLVSGSRG